MDPASDLLTLRKNTAGLESPSTPVSPHAVPVRVWDGPTRLSHWAVAALFGFSWWSARSGHLDYHRWSGLTLLGVLALRVVWGFVGSGTAKFAHFVKGPRTVWRYVRGQLDSRPPGHNPLGALSVLAMLALLAAQVGLGLFSVDVDGLESGPLSDRVSFETGRLCARLHGLGFNLLLTLVGIHLLAVLAHLLIKRDNLIVPMITGWKK